MVEFEVNDNVDGEDKDKSRWRKIRERVERIASDLGFRDIELPEEKE